MKVSIQKYKSAMIAKRRLIITIDGPAGSGKSTTAKRVAEKLQYRYLDSGALYRAVTLAAIKAGVDWNDANALAELASKCDIRLEYNQDGLRVMLNGEQVTHDIRRPDVAQAIGPVAGNEGVRTALLQRQRQLGEDGGIVAEGRDMGTVVFPEADLKFFMVAAIEERARRRQRDLIQIGIEKDLETIKKNIGKRDADDSSRDLSPLRKPEDAIEIDTTLMTIEQQVEFIVDAAIKAGAE